MIKQRITKNLGLNRSADKEKIYQYIENVLGVKTKFCSRGRSKLQSRYGLTHVGENPLPIRMFNLDGAYIDPDGKINVKKIGLQPYCISCERKYRRGRLERWLKKYSKMTDKEVYADYKKNYGLTAKCSRCGENKKPEEFGISRRMDKGLHNVCLQCSKNYSESVGNRWIIFSPDGRNAVSIKNAECKYCGDKNFLHKDHIWPLAKGGTDFPENIQILCDSCNLSKSDSIQGISSVSEVKTSMICERYQGILKKALSEKWPLEKFELEISKEVRKFLISKKQMTDKVLRDFFTKEKVKNNRKHSIDRALRKFREYSNAVILDISTYISKP